VDPLLQVAVVAVLVTAGAEVVWAARQLVDAAAAACLSMPGGVLFAWYARRLSARWLRW